MAEWSSIKILLYKPFVLPVCVNKCKGKCARDGLGSKFLHNLCDLHME